MANKNKIRTQIKPAAYQASANKLVVVLGMHRSGTSALTRGLEVLGVGLGQNLMPAAENNNEKGFFEDIDISRLNDSLLAKLGTAWDSLALIDSQLLLGDDYRIERQEARRVLAGKLKGCEVFAFKDPRASILLPFWKQIFADMQLDVGYVISVRNPLSVAASLYKRDGMHETLSLLLWLKYVTAAILDSTDTKRTIVDYDQLMLDPEGQLLRVATALSLPSPRLNPAALTEYSCDFLSSVLRHNVCGPQQLLNNPSVPTAVYELYRNVLDVLSGADSASLQSTLNNVVNLWAEVKPVLKDIDLLIREGRLAKEQVSTLQNDLQNAANGINMLQRDLISRQESLSNIEIALDNKTAQEIALSLQLTGLKNESDLLTQALSQRNESLDQAQIKIEQMLQALADQAVLEFALHQQLSSSKSECSTAWSMNDQANHEKLALAEQLNASKSECSTAWSMNDQANHEKLALAEQMLFLQIEQQRLHAQHEQLLASTSWRLTRPLRGIRRHYRQPLFLLRALVSTVLRTLWRKFPGQSLKQSIKHALFTVFGFALRSTKAYQDWQRFRASGELHLREPEPEEAIAEDLGSDALPAAPQEHALALNEPIQHVPRLLAAPAEIMPAKIIAFYLPQFHPIAENNLWWGEGFTEWTNVRPAKMHYQGHYQPHVPGDLGYYSLLDIETQRKQVELAKLYGIGGFCFYYYWFAGKRLLDAPVEQYLLNAELDLPFCLCWANENWSRRWDGLDSEILMAQEYSEADDLAFIENISRYLKDPRYIRIDGMPLVIMYRPSLLPNARKTAKRWRKWCREHGIGEIYLAYTQSFENEDPAKYGFDAAIEFPPNNTAPPNVTENVTPLTTDFAGQVYDYKIYMQRSKTYSATNYTLFRGVCPSWDNTARRKNNGISFVNSSPRGYQEWLVDAISDTCQRQSNPDERLVFVNAWNEWAEGAHLEPDQRYGYGFLEATRMAQLRSQLHQMPEPVANGKLAIVIHAFYPEVFAEIVEYLNAINAFELKLFISTPQAVSEQVKALARQSLHPWVVKVCPNHGRDVLPFLKLLPEVIAEGFEYLIKVHTKKSVHRQDGDVWRRDLYDKLLICENIEQAMNLMARDPKLGILGPEGHVVPMGYYWGSNAATVEELACRLGAKPDHLSHFAFVAGTMFLARTSAFMPLLNLALSEQDFEHETGQVDGTLAHAIERAISISAWAAGLQIATAGSVTVEKNYAFAKACV